MLWRAQLRTTALALLTAALESGGATVVSSKDTPAQDESLPLITIYVDDTKVFDYGAAPTARTTATLTINVEASGTSKDTAESLRDTLCEMVEDTLFGTPDFVKLFEMIDSCDSFTDESGAKGDLHFASATIEIKGHTSEIWEPARGVDLKGINIYVDSVNIFDPNGDYTGETPFNVANPAPRTSGPDGRPEVGAAVDTSS